MGKCRGEILKLTCWVVLPGFVAAMPAPGMMLRDDVATAGLPHCRPLSLPSRLCHPVRQARAPCHLCCPARHEDGAAFRCPPAGRPSIALAVRALTPARGARRRRRPRFAGESREPGEAKTRQVRCDGGLADGDRDHRARAYLRLQSSGREEREAAGREPVGLIRLRPEPPPAAR